MSVWVCLSSEFARDTYRAFKTKDSCPACKDGVCGTDNNPCDAVEYAPKRDLDTAIKERDLLQERCDELRKKLTEYAEVKRGKWLRGTKYVHDASCPFCDFRIHDAATWKTLPQYCENCGCKMEG